MDNFLLVASQTLTLFVLIGVGALCRKLKLIDAASVGGMVNVLVLIVTPALIVNVFQRPFDAGMLSQLGLAFMIAILAHVGIIAAAILTVRDRDPARRPVLRTAITFSNAGFMGIPLEYEILGPKGVFFGVIYVAVFNLMIWSWGLKSMIGDDGGKPTLAMRLKMIVNPGTIGLALGLPLFLTSTALPDFLARPVRFLSDLNTPLAMLVIGYFLAGADLGKIFRLPGAYAAMFARLIGYPCLVMAALYPFRDFVDHTLAVTMTIAAAAPVAAMVSMFAAKYQRDVSLAVGLVSGSAIASVFTMPPLIALALRLFPVTV